MAKAIEQSEIISSSFLKVAGTNMAFDYPKTMRFLCVKCGICCGDTKAKVRHILLLRTEAEYIAEAVEKPISEFANKVEGKAPYRYEVRKTAQDDKCVFLRENRCTIYSVRPIICRFYPFELRITENHKHMFDATDECPGIGKGKTLNEEHFQAMFKLANERARMERRRN
jgi:Fe-S-cluster containining protein